MYGVVVEDEFGISGTTAAALARRGSRRAFFIPIHLQPIYYELFAGSGSRGGGLCQRGLPALGRDPHRGRGGYVCQAVAEVQRSRMIRFRPGSENVRRYVLDCVDRAGSLAAYVGRFERDFALLRGSSRVATSNGTTALHLCLATLGIGRGRVLVPDLTFVSTANVVRYTGATPCW
jgi:hypothetical protein